MLTPAAIVGLKTLYMPCLDFYPEVEDEANRWFDKDHIAERLHCTGWLSCERFQRATVEPWGYQPREEWPKYMNMFVVEGPAGPLRNDQRLQMVSPGEWRTALNARVEELGLGDAVRRGPASPWFIARTIAGPRRGVWVQRPSPWANLRTVVMPPPRAILVLFMDFDPDDVEIDRYRDEAAIPDLLSCAGVLGCERFEAATPEARSEEPRPRFLEIYDLESPEVVSSAAFRRNREAVIDSALEARITLWGSAAYVQRPSPWALRPLM